MMLPSNKDNKVVKARSLLKSAGVRVRRERDRFVFEIPVETAETIRKEYGFSFDQLKVGGEIPLSELAIHIDEQAALEARIGFVAEVCRYKLEILRLDYEMWEKQISHKCRTYLWEKEGKTASTVGVVVDYMHTKYGKEMRAKKKQIAELEFQFRLLNNVFRSAVEVKGTLLPTLRNIIQGKSDGIGAIDVKVVEKNRKKLKV